MINKSLLLFTSHEIHDFFTPLPCLSHLSPKSINNTITKTIKQFINIDEHDFI